MVGLSKDTIDILKKDLAIGRVKTDLQSDFIIAPQYKVIFDFLADELWEMLIQQLKSGTYLPSSLITVEVPKPTGMTRPGAIAHPLDRVLYQTLADTIAPVLDGQMDDDRVVSYRLLDPDPSCQMFQSRGDGFRSFRAKSNEVALYGSFSHAFQADITSYFVHLNHHTLENSLAQSGISPGTITLLVKHLLQTWSGRFSYGIPQGMFPSDLLGNFYLSALDSYLAVQNIRSLRYVDDLVLFYDSEKLARSSLASICNFLRSIGLDLNEHKSKVISVNELVNEQSELDRMFEEARQEIVEQIEKAEWEIDYGFLDPWEESQSYQLLGGDIELLALHSLWGERIGLEVPRRDQLDVFCLAGLGIAGSDDAIEVVMGELGQRPHLTRAYCHYLARFARTYPEVKKALCEFIERDACTYDWELQWPILALMSAENLPSITTNKLLSLLDSKQRGNELRALCAIAAGKYGSAANRTFLRQCWASEDSEHVKAALVLSCRFFGKEERNILLDLWGKQNALFDLVARAMREEMAIS